MDNDIIMFNHKKETRDSDKKVTSFHFPTFGKTLRLTSDPEKDTVVTVTRGTVEIVTDDASFKVSQNEIHIIQKGENGYNITSKCDTEDFAGENRLTSIVLVT